MRAIHSALIKTGEGWLTINDLVDIVYPDRSTWRQRERRRFAVRKAVTALERDQLLGVRVIRQGAGTGEKVRADLTSWTGQQIGTPRPRDRHPWPEAQQSRGPCLECRCLSYDGSGPGSCSYCGHAYTDHKA
jgi:hypothetical protein